jgi:predicted ester cyclase
MDAAANEAHVRRFIDEVWSGGNLDVIDELTTPDVILHSAVLPGPAHGRAALREYVLGLRTACPDLQFTVEEFLVDGDRIANRGFFHGTHTGDLLGIPPTNRPIKVGYTEFAHMRDGQAAEIWILPDLLGFMQQIGMVPRDGAGPREIVGSIVLGARRARRLSKRQRAKARGR